MESQVGELSGVVNDQGSKSSKMENTTTTIDQNVQNVLNIISKQHSGGPTGSGGSGGVTASSAPPGVAAAGIDVVLTGEETPPRAVCVPNVDPEAHANIVEALNMKPDRNGMAGIVEKLPLPFVQYWDFLSKMKTLAMWKDKLLKIGYNNKDAPIVNIQQVGQIIYQRLGDDAYLSGNDYNEDIFNN